MEGTILFILSVLKSYSFTDAGFIYVPSETGFCDGTNANLTWVFDNAGAQAVVQWSVNDTTSVARLLGGSTFIEEAGYIGKLQNDGNGGLIIKSVTQADSGKYKCVVIYSDGTPQDSSEKQVTIYSTLNTQIQILENNDGKEATLTSSLFDSSITYSWSSSSLNNIGTGSSITVTEEGIYKLCISGGKATCLNQTLSNCVNRTVSGLHACGSFHCGFWLLLLVVVTSIIILILMWKKVKRFGFSASGCSNMKIGITVVFSVVAIGIGLGLGLGLREGEENCLECGATIGISIALGVALSVIEFIVIIKCDKEKVSVFRAVINITSESYTDDLKDCTSRAYKDLSRRVTKAIESLYKNVPGQQTVVDLKFSPGLKVTFDLSSQGFDDCSVLSDTLNNALQSGLISPFKVNSVGFEFMPLQDWKESKGETSDRSNGDRARSPASASAIKVEAENKSHIKPTGKKTEESSLHIKSYGSPLPEVPKVRHNQLDPIPKSDNGEMDNSHNKPYTKLYGSPLPEVPQGRSIPLVPIQRQDIDEMESPKVEKKKKKKKKKKREDSVDNEEDN